MRSISSHSAPSNPTCNEQEKPKEKACSVCSASSSPLSVLLPCEHLICSSCLTGALNIIGEKDMRCATCDKSVDNFKLLAPLKIGNSGSEKGEESPSDGTQKQEETSALLPSALENHSSKGEANSAQQVKSRSQTPSVRSASGGSVESLSVLRIDNVPWVSMTPYCHSQTLKLL